MFISLTGDTQGLRLWLTRRQSWSQLLANMRIPCRIRSKWPRYQTTAFTAMAAGLENGDGWHICQPTRKLWEGMLAKFVTYFVYSDGMGKLYISVKGTGTKHLVSWLLSVFGWQRFSALSLSQDTAGTSAVDICWLGAGRGWRGKADAFSWLRIRPRPV